MNIGRYNAKDCTVTIDNVRITGLGEDMISAEKEEDFFSTSVGAQGDVIKNEINNTLGTITVTVQPTSPQKTFLLGLAKRSTTFPIWCINKSLKERIGGTQASLKTFPEFSRGAEAEDMEFTFQVFDLTVEATE
ncbi:MAG: phage structural protein [Acutalibacteraceae bacterium]